jgi:hypothetical protein
MLSVIVLCSVVLTFCVCYMWQKRHLYRVSRQLNGESSWTILGNGLSLTEIGNERK